MARKPSFEESIDQINSEILKRKSKWNLTAIAWMDFYDVSQILRFHIYKKWHLYDSSKPLAPWINRIISNQIKNLIRNNYSNFTRPCLKCNAAENEDGCAIYTTQCSACPLYANWEKNKKNAHDAKLTLSVENYAKEINNIPNDNLNLEISAKNIHTKMENILKPIEWKIYKHLYIEGRTEEQVAKLMGYRTSEKNRIAGYKQIKNVKKSIIFKVKKHLYNGDIDII
ncbi:MAG: sigma-70 family RNA polymerase sigma factor [Proteobacteria bacterium]|nr:sigma-70 family RNA polymerase sigma factor [Pseudomonadota bacterium]